MAKTRKSKGPKIAVLSMGPSRPRVHASIEKAENGYVVNTSGHGEGGFHDKTHVAHSHGGAMRIATGHLRSLAGSKLGKKKLGKKFGSGSGKKSAA
jgi:hypothetical protein